MLKSIHRPNGARPIKSSIIFNINIDNFMYCIFAYYIMFVPNKFVS